MGVNISDPHLACTCAKHSQILATVSLVAAGPLLARFLQKGDPGGHYQRALAHFPFPEVAERIIKEYFIEEGIPATQKFKTVPAFHFSPRAELIELTVAGSFAAVWLAKEGHGELVSANLLEKIQVSLIHHIYGAMLAGIDVITMGAGITLQIPGVLEAFSRGRAASYRVHVEGSKEGFEMISFDPKAFFANAPGELALPLFLPIVSTDVLASLMDNRLPEGAIKGFVLEKYIAGGHNAPPRGRYLLNEFGEPIYGIRDQVNFKKVLDLGYPFWIGGGFASPEGLAQAQELGAVGIQAGGIFALCEQSGMKPHNRNEIRRLGYRGELQIRTDPKASPTGFPFKIVQLVGTHSVTEVYEARERICDLGALSVPYARTDGTIGFRCPGEPVGDFIRKGGKLEDTNGVRCLCNSLLSAAGIANPNEPPIFTLGDDVSFLRHLMDHENDSYNADEAITYLLSQTV